MFWMSAFLDLAPGSFDAGATFWSRVTGYDVSPRRGARDEFATLVPGQGDDFLRVQELEEGSGRLHLDLHVDDPTDEAGRAVARGAVVRHESAHGYVVLDSPGGLTFCFVRHQASERPPPAVWPGGHRSLVDQVCLDIPPSSYDVECAFWRDLTGESLVPSSVSEQFQALTRPPDQPLRVLLQRLDDEQARVAAHLDLSTSDRDLEATRHEELGATVVGRHERWTVLTDPLGQAYCLTDRDPETGLLP
jgi:hypothetical protein